MRGENTPIQRKVTESWRWLGEPRCTGVVRRWNSRRFRFRDHRNIWGLLICWSELESVWRLCEKSPGWRGCCDGVGNNLRKKRMRQRVTKSRAVFLIKCPAGVSWPLTPGSRLCKTRVYVLWSAVPWDRFDPHRSCHGALVISAPFPHPSF